MVEKCIHCDKPIWKGNKWHRNFWGIYCEEHEIGNYNFKKEVKK